MNSTDLYTDAAETFTLESGIERMMTDLNDFVCPKIAGVRPLLSAFASVSFIIIPIVFFAFVVFVFIYKKYDISSKFTKTTNYIWYAAFILLYCLLLNVGYSYGYGLDFNFSKVVLPTAAKFFGPAVGGVFAILFYIISCLSAGGTINVLSLLIAAISGIIYGLVFYRKKTRYTRCLGCKICVGLFCNSFLQVLALYKPFEGDFVGIMAGNIISSVLIAPISALGIYLAFKLVRLIKNAYSI